MLEITSQSTLNIIGIVASCMFTVTVGVVVTTVAIMNFFDWAREFRCRQSTGVSFNALVRTRQSLITARDWCVFDFPIVGDVADHLLVIGREDEGRVIQPWELRDKLRQKYPAKGMYNLEIPEKHL